MSIFKIIGLSIILFVSNLAFSETNVRNKYIEENMSFLSEPKTFISLDVDSKDMWRWVNELDSVFKQTFKEDEEEKIVGVTIILSGIDKANNDCKKDYTKCVSMGINIKYTPNITEEEKKDFNDKVFSLKEILIKNSKSKDSASFLIFISNKIENKNNII